MLDDDSACVLLAVTSFASNMQCPGRETVKNASRVPRWISTCDLVLVFDFALPSTAAAFSACIPTKPNPRPSGCRLSKKLIEKSLARACLPHEVSAVELLFQSQQMFHTASAELPRTFASQDAADEVMTKAAKLCFALIVCWSYAFSEQTGRTQPMLGYREAVTMSKSACIEDLSSSVTTNLDVQPTGPGLFC